MSKDFILRKIEEGEELLSILHKEFQDNDFNEVLRATSAISIFLVVLDINKYKQLLKEWN